MARLLGIDVGTSGAKALVIDETGRVIAQGSAEYPLSVPQPLWSEQSPEDWWAGVQSCLAQVGGGPFDAIGVTGQMHGSVFLDGSNEVIRPAILWNDQRTAAECADMDEIVGAARLRSITCNPPLTGFQAPKVLWLRKHEPENFARIRSVLLPKDYIRYRLTGEKATDVSDASGVGLVDVPQRAWSLEMMEALQLDPSWFPPIFESDEVTGKTPDGTPVIAGGGDQAAGAVGTGAVEPEVLSVSLGTSGVVFTAIPTADYDPSGAAHTFCHANRQWHAMGVMLSCGGAVRWLRDTFYSSQGYDAMNADAARIAPGADGLTFAPYLTGERCPHNDPHATGSFSGLNLSHTQAHFSRSVFEGVSFGLLDGLNLLRGLGADASEIRVTGGGAKSALWLQMLADVFGVPCLTLTTDEGPAYGASILAGVGIGIWPNVVEACHATIQVKHRVSPSGTSYEVPYRRYRALYPALRCWNQS